MSVEISAPARASAGSVINPRANEAREQVVSSQIMDWVARGYVFSFGLLSDDTTNIATVTTLADTTPTISLQSPAGGDIIVVPLRVSASIVDDGGGLSTIDLVYTKAAKDCATAMTLSGTAMTGIINHLTRSPALTTRASVLRTVTASALTVVDSIVIDHAEMVDAGLTTGLIQLNERYDYEFNIPVYLMEGAALLIYGVTATTAGEIRPSITWAEIPAAIYKP